MNFLCDNDMYFEVQLYFEFIGFCKLLTIETSRRVAGLQALEMTQK